MLYNFKCNVKDCLRARCVLRLIWPKGSFLDYFLAKSVDGQPHCESVKKAHQLFILFLFCSCLRSFCFPLFFLSLCTHVIILSICTTTFESYYRRQNWPWCSSGQSYLSPWKQHQNKEILVNAKYKMQMQYIGKGATYFIAHSYICNNMMANPNQQGQENYFEVLRHVCF